MKKKIGGLLLMLCLICTVALEVHAETFYGDSGWQVSFTADSKMETNFKNKDLTEAIMGLQPGDNIIFTVNLKNSNKSATDWYMTNEVLYSLEDRSANSATNGGAYTYILTYTGKDGNARTLFSSDTVGGDTSGGAEEGLHGATDGLEDYFYLDTLASGKSGKITLEIALDGETQGNDYQDTLADLQMNFAVETTTNTPGENTPGTNTPGNNTSDSSRPNRNAASAGTRTGVVKTGDEVNLVPLYVVMGVTGALFLILAFYSLRRGKKDGKGEE